jgi:hypothetical protein
MTTQATLYAGDDGVTFIVFGIAKTEALGKVRETLSLRFGARRRRTQ